MHPRASDDPAYVLFVPLFSIVLVCCRRRCLQSALCRLVLSFFVFPCFVCFLSCVLVSVTYFVLVFGEQKMVQRLKEVVAEYEDRLRKIQLVPRFTVPLYRLVLSFWCVSDDAGNKSLCLCRLVLSFWCFQRRC